MRTILSSSFMKAYKKLPVEVIIQLELKQKMFFKDHFHPSLKTHKLSGRMKEFYSFSINYKYRVIFKFLEHDTVMLISIGTHDIYD